MNLGIQDGAQLIQDICSGMPALQAHQHVVFCTPFTHLSAAKEVLQSVQKTNTHLGAQNCHPNPSGAYTGEISIAMLQESSVDHVIIGHSERRQYFQESNTFLKQKTDALIAQQMHVIFCCGEPLEIREAGTQNEYVAAQLAESLFHLTPDQLQQQVVIAYEPIWAIGTGVTASTQQAQDMHAFIRGLLASTYNDEVAANISILYGGSCNASNAAELFACADVDGGLIGGAALKSETFLPIIQALS